MDENKKTYVYNVPITDEETFMRMEDLFYEIQINKRCLRGMSSRVDGCIGELMVLGMERELGLNEDRFKELCRKYMNDAFSTDIGTEAYPVWTPDVLDKHSIFIVSVNNPIEKFEKYLT